VDWFFSWDSTGVPDDFIVISAKATDGRSWSAPANRQVEVDNGVNVTGESGIIKKDNSKDINWVTMSIIILIVVLLIIGLLVMFLIIRRSKKRIMDYVPDGRIEPLEEVEARLRPELGAGVSIEHAPLPPSSAAGASGALPALPSAAPISASGTTLTMAKPALPSTTTSTGGPVATRPALPPAKAHADSADGGEGGYGLYSPKAASVPVTSAGGYAPKPATATPVEDKKNN
jgi:hypothetical protein